MTTQTRPMILSDADRLKIQSAVLELVNNTTVMNNYGIVIDVTNMTELTVEAITVSDNLYSITYTHDDPSIASPVTFDIPKHRLGMYFGEDIISLFEQGGQA